MPVATHAEDPKAKAISPDLEAGVVADAESFLKPNPERVEAARRLEAVEQYFRETRERTDATVVRAEQISAELRAAPSEAERKKLAAERQALTGELVHASEDVAAAAEPYAEAVIKWAPGVIQAAKAVLKAIRAETGPLIRERSRLLAQIDSDVPVERQLSRAETDAVSKKAKALFDQLQPLLEREQQAEDLANRAASVLTTKFGPPNGSEDLYLRSGPQRWIDSVRASVANRAVKLTGVTGGMRTRRSW